MSITSDRGGREQGKFKESTDVSGQVGVVVVNADGSSVGGGNVTSLVPGTGATNLGKAEDAPHSSGDTGVMVFGVYKATPTQLSGTDSDYSPPTLDANGALWVSLATLIKGEDETNNLLGILPKPVAVSTYSWSRFVDFGANATANVKASAGNVFSFECHNLNGSARYLQFHNTATTPSAGAVPLYTFLVPAGGAITRDGQFFGQAGANFSTGIAFAFSTTEGTYTAGSAADQFTQIHYK